VKFESTPPPPEIPNHNAAVKLHEPKKPPSSISRTAALPPTKSIPGALQGGEQAASGTCVHPYAPHRPCVLVGALPPRRSTLLSHASLSSPVCPYRCSRPVPRVARFVLVHSAHKTDYLSLRWPCAGEFATARRRSLRCPLLHAVRSSVDGSDRIGSESTVKHTGQLTCFTTIFQKSP
jgi:hypothetical protein